jgi:hypothetical protein
MYAEENLFVYPLSVSFALGSSPAIQLPEIRGYKIESRYPVYTAESLWILLTALLTATCIRF